jgi:hypothetical protein
VVSEDLRERARDPPLGIAQGQDELLSSRFRSKDLVVPDHV